MGTAATPIGNCPNCGGTRYAGLTHHCTTVALLAGLPLTTGEGIARPKVASLIDELRALREGAAPTINQYEAADWVREIEDLLAERDALREQLRFERLPCRVDLRIDRQRPVDR